jgi:hypothetical protein
LEIYADEEIRRSEFVTLSKYVIGDKCTKRNKDLSSNISGRKVEDQKRYMTNHSPHSATTLISYHKSKPGSRGSKTVICPARIILVPGSQS